MLLLDALPAHARIRRRFRHGALGALLLLAIFGAALGLVVLIGGSWAARASWLARLLAAPFLLGLVALLLVVAQALLAACVQALRPTNWLVALGQDRAWIHLRSYLAAGGAERAETVLELSYRAIALARRVRETVEAPSHDGVERAQRSWLELELHGVDLGPIADALRREQLRPAPVRTFLGVRSSARFLHRPVRVSAAGTLHVEWRAGLLRALEERGVRVERVPRNARKVVVAGPQLLSELVEAGRVIDAVRLLVEREGLPLSEARRRVAELERA